MWQHKQGAKKDEPVKRRCHRCRGMGRAPCEICKGAGELIQSRDIHGKPKMGHCNGCFGLKATRCAVCGGDGFL